jgi:kinetochore protein Spc24
MEGEIGNKEVELAALKEEARKLEEYDPATEHEKEMDGDAYVVKVNFCAIYIKERYDCRLRLDVYKALGFEPVQDRNGHITKMLIRKSEP